MREGIVGAGAGAFAGLVDTEEDDVGEIVAGKPACCLSVAPGIAFCTIGDKLDRAGLVATAGAILLLPGVAFGIGAILLLPGVAFGVGRK
jgi:hypothetical protein